MLAADMLGSVLGGAGLSDSGWSPFRELLVYEKEFEGGRVVKEGRMAGDGDGRNERPVSVVRVRPVDGEQRVRASNRSDCSLFAIMEASLVKVEIM